MKDEHVSPKEFLRARRPERFSDSAIWKEPTLDRSMLEYQLDTLTSKSQETNFERFARHLAERAICPNLLPQTGPTGGGDSGVDTETYPVADDLSLVWYVGIGREAASERWGFAFSAKKEWRQKLRSDVAKIADTNRGYEKAFFVSNQFIRDKVRADLEDELSAKHHLDVRILDRTWILDKVFGEGYEALAVEDLELTTPSREEKRRGPLDTQRERDLERLEKRISDTVQLQRFGPQVVDDCINAAILSTQLERSSIETEGRFERADRMAIKYGTKHQRLECVYNRAWMAFWWDEDYERFAELFGTAEERAKGSRNAYDLELLTNLWFLLHWLVERRDQDESQTSFQKRTDTLMKELARLSEEENRPSTALQGRTMLLLVNLNLKLATQDPIEPVIQELQDVVHRSKGLVGYPLEPLVKILMELGEILEDVPGYEELFDTIIEVASNREGDISAARMLLKRGEQQINADRPYDAIRSLSRALSRLYKNESRYDFVHALYLCGCAYERISLLWAARGVLLMAASVATDELWTYGTVTSLQAACFRRLKWLELQLGRLPQILAWHATDTVVRASLAEQGRDEDVLSEGNSEFDLITGILLLKTELWELKRLTTLPDVLEEMELPSASIALRYALGYEEDLQDQGFRATWGDRDIHSVILQWRDQPASKELPEYPSIYDGRKVKLSSSVLGCQITIESENNSPCVELAESVLAALESLLSTGIVESMAAREPIMTVTVRKSDFAKQPFDFELEDRDGRPHMTIACREFDTHSMLPEAQSEIQRRLMELLATIIGSVVAMDDPDQVFEKLFGDQLALDRCIGFTGSFVTLGNVLGYDPKTRISNWVDSQAQEYRLKRSRAWDADDPSAERDSNLIAGTINTRHEGEPPPELLDRGYTKHAQMQTISLIREKFWNEAKWFGTAFLTTPDGSSPPVLALVFNQSEAAKQIFVQWRNELGNRDDHERLRIAIVRGIDKTKPYSYRIIIGSNPNDGYAKPDVRHAVFVSRVHTMEPATGSNLQRFLDNYNAFGGYLLAPAIAKDGVSEPEVILDHSLIKRELHVREAWEIGRHDVDGVAIHEGDAVVVPPGQKNPPVLELLRWKREHSNL